MSHSAESSRGSHGWRGLRALVLGPWLLATAVELHRGHHLADVSPNVFTRLDQLDAFVDAIREVLRNGLPEA